MQGQRERGGGGGRGKCMGRGGRVMFISMVFQFCAAVSKSVTLIDISVHCFEYTLVPIEIQ